MPNSIKKLEEAFKEGKYDQLLKDIYVDESVLAYQQERYIKALESFKDIYGEKEVEIYSKYDYRGMGGRIRIFVLCEKCCCLTVRLPIHTRQISQSRLHNNRS